MAVDPVKSAKRALEVLERFSEDRRPMTGAEISQLLNYPKSSTNALLHSLVSLGYLDLDDVGKTYFSTIRVARLGDWLPALLPGRFDLEELLLRVNRVTRETVTLSTQAGDEMLFVQVVPSPHPIGLNLDAGSRAPLLGSAVGLALLASQSDEQMMRMLLRLKIDTGYGKPEQAQLSLKVQGVRSRGYAIVYDGVIPGTGALATALPVKAPATPIILGVGGPIERIRANEEAIGALLLRIVSDLKRAKDIHERAAAIDHG